MRLEVRPVTASYALVPSDPVREYLDFEKVLELDSNCVEAKQELVITRDLLLASHKARKADRAHDDGFDEDEDSDVEDYDNDSKLEPWEVEMFALPALSDADMETPFESDTADFEHEGNDVPCRFYNHEGCNQGTECKYKHAPDDRSVRDHLCAVSSPSLLTRA